MQEEAIIEEQTNQYLTFTLAQELFALDITAVREILEVPSITKIPRTPEFMTGVINLRGQAVPVIDLRQKFGMGSYQMTVDTCIIITEVLVDDDSTVLGALADSVQEVFEIEPDQIDAPPKMGTVVDVEFIKGMSRHKDGFLMILDINKVFSQIELAVLAGTKSQETPAE